MVGDPLGGLVADAVGQGLARFCKLGPLHWSRDVRPPVLSSGARTLWATPPACTSRSSSSGSASGTSGHLGAPKQLSSWSHRCASFLPLGLPGPEVVVAKATSLSPSREERTDREASHRPPGLCVVPASTLQIVRSQCPRRMLTPGTVAGVPKTCFDWSGQGHLFWLV